MIHGEGFLTISNIRQDAEDDLRTILVHFKRLYICTYKQSPGYLIDNLR
jgi:hypothetical protein